MYANSRFKKRVNEWGRVEEWIMPGDEISQGDLDIGDEEWQGLIDSGAVVDSYPEGLKDSPQTPPAEYYRNNPEEAPSSDLDESSSSAEMMAAGDTGQPLPDGGANEGTNKPPWAS
jgi:hypothetical protein